MSDVEMFVVFQFMKSCLVCMWVNNHKQAHGGIVNNEAREGVCTGRGMYGNGINNLSEVIMAKQIKHMRLCV